MNGVASAFASSRSAFLPTPLAHAAKPPLHDCAAASRMNWSLQSSREKPNCTM